MAYTKKTAPAAFGDILAGLGATAERPPAGPASSREGVKTALGMDVSWVQSARMRALAAQMAHRVTAPSAELRQADAGDRRGGSGDDLAASWRSAAGEQSSRPGQPYRREAEEAPDPAEPAGASAQAGSVERPAPVPNGVRSNPVHALQRLLGQLPKRLRAGAGAAASALGAVGGARAQAAATKPAAPNPGAQAASARKSEDETIAEELGLREDLAIGDLRRIRRDFAKKNHPDRFEPALRLGAARRMTIANMLIDARLKQRPPSP